MRIDDQEVQMNENLRLVLAGCLLFWTSLARGIQILLIHWRHHG